MVKPAACRARSADSRPEPGPQTSTSRVRTPCSCALRATSSAATCAANGVDLREPLNPCAPADDQAIELPCASVMVIIVLLNDELTCATPDEMFLRSRRRTRTASLAIYFLSNDLDAAVVPAATPERKCVANKEPYSLFAISLLAYFFLPAMALAGPLRVRAL